MYTFWLRILYPENTLRGALSGQHPNCKQYVKFSLPVPLGFCCGGFSSTAGYVPGNEAKPYKTMWRLIGPLQDDLSFKASSVFIRKIKFAEANLRKPFGFDSERFNSLVPPLADVIRRVTADEPPFSVGQSAHKQPRL